MRFLKKVILFSFIILCLIGIYKDLQLGFSPGKENTSATEPVLTNMDYQVSHVQARTGETVLSIVERIHASPLTRINPAQILADFQTMNPSADPNKLETGRYYYFPLYKNRD
ncbi:hypothetical protein [Lentibacillus sediminis]|uniref:hypothetical protein n=1 Tax=Lentibacillus sediminis TaxID=1940529 RepID=UPI000C1C281A|nr:hypothetical protein [Lentibacillus sediminis]